MKEPIIRAALVFVVILQVLALHRANDTIDRQREALSNLIDADTRLKEAARDLETECNQVAVLAGLATAGAQQ